MKGFSESCISEDQLSIDERPTWMECLCLKEKSLLWDGVIQAF